MRDCITYDQCKELLQQGPYELRLKILWGGMCLAQKYELVNKEEIGMGKVKEYYNEQPLNEFTSYEEVDQAMKDIFEEEERMALEVVEKGNRKALITGIIIGWGISVILSGLTYYV